MRRNHSTDRFAGRETLEDRLHRDARPRDHRLSPHDAGVGNDESVRHPPRVSCRFCAWPDGDLAACACAQVVSSSRMTAAMVVRARPSSSGLTVMPPTAAWPPPPKRAHSAPTSCRRVCLLQGLTPTEILMLWAWRVPDTA